MVTNSITYAEIISTNWDRPIWERVDGLPGSSANARLLQFVALLSGAVKPHPRPLACLDVSLAELQFPTLPGTPNTACMLMGARNVH